MGKFIFTQTEIPGVVVIEPQVFGDDRGYFMETYQIDEFAAAGIDKPFVQNDKTRSPRMGQGPARGTGYGFCGPRHGAGAVQPAAMAECRGSAGLCGHAG